MKKYLIRFLIGFLIIAIMFGGLALLEYYAEKIFMALCLIVGMTGLVFLSHKIGKGILKNDKH